MKKKDPNYVLIMVFGMLAILIIHYFIILKFNLHPTLQVFISFMLFWIYLAIVATYPKK
ncbi:hypothetical protein HY212_02405 [Candidatus Pacearchaeota archaeon]|nr:hypothetical protein [Candidatus Pacearchaeota archaeon]